MNNNQIEPKNEPTQIELLKQINNNLQRLIKSNENTQYMMVNIAYHFLNDRDENVWEVVEDLHTCVHNRDQYNYIPTMDC